MERREITERNKQRLAAWEAEVILIEAKRRGEWQRKVEEVERARALVEARNQRAEVDWRAAMERHREVVDRIAQHNAEIQRRWARYERENQRRRAACDAVEARVRQLQQSWNVDSKALGAERDAIYEALRDARTKYAALKAQFEQERAALSANQMENRFRNYLESILIENASIKGIGRARKATLAAYGIETALDITGDALDNVPGFGPALRADLVGWRGQVERQFRFQPTMAASSPVQLRSLHLKYQRERTALQRDLLAGERQLLDAKDRAERRLYGHKQKLQALLPDLWQAEADLSIMKW